MTAAKPRTYVLGGGVAGLAAAFGLADRGHRVTLLESRSWLGGRAFASPDATSGQRLDNGPHVMLGCYHAMRALLRRLGTEQEFQQDRALTLAYRQRGGRVLRLALARVTVPLAMPWALLRLPIPLGARLRALRGMVATLRTAPPGCTLADWLQRHRQQGLPDALLWRPLCRAVMNVEPDLCAADDFLVTLREAFAGPAGAAAFWLPRRTWGELIGDPAPQALAAAGVELQLGARLVAIECAEGRVAALVLGDGRRLAVGPDDAVVSALPWFKLESIFAGLPAPVGALAASPIVSAFVELPPTTAPLPDDGPVTALVDGDPFHFVMRTPGGDPRRIALLAGGNRSFDGQPVATVAARSLAQLAAWYPGAVLDGAAVRIRKEQRATFVAACGSAAARPRPGRLPGGPRNLHVCGDWTATGLPATLEGAARSAAAMLAAW